MFDVRCGTYNVFIIGNLACKKQAKTNVIFIS